MYIYAIYVIILDIFIKHFRCLYHNSEYSYAMFRPSRHEEKINSRIFDEIFVRQEADVHFFGITFSLFYCIQQNFLIYAHLLNNRSFMHELGFGIAFEKIDKGVVNC